jgi:hypothetical protein
MDGAEDLHRLNARVLWMDGADADGEGALRLSRGHTAGEFSQATKVTEGDEVARAR